jgi:hypothetical protein
MALRSRTHAATPSTDRGTLPHPCLHLLGPFFPHAGPGKLPPSAKLTYIPYYSDRFGGFYNVSIENIHVDGVGDLAEPVSQLPNAWETGPWGDTHMCTHPVIALCLRACIRTFAP